MTTIEICQRMNSHRKCQGHATKTLPKRKDTGKGLPSKIHLTMYLVWRVQVLNISERFFFSLDFASPLHNQTNHYYDFFFGIQKKKKSIKWKSDR